MKRIRINSNKSEKTSAKGDPKRKRGAQPGHKGAGGRPVGSVNRLSKEAVEKAKASGLLPHEWLLEVMRADKESISKVLRFAPTVEQRIDAAKACANYFAPKIAQVTMMGPNGGPIPVLQLSPDQLKRLKPDELAALERALGRLQRSTDDGEGGASPAGNAEAYAATLGES